MTVRIFKLKSLTVESIVPALMELFCFYGGAVEVLYTDDASAFRSKIMAAFVEVWRIQHRLVAPYHHASNGYAEKECYETLRVLRNLLYENMKMNADRWPDYLPIVEWVRNSCPRLSRAGLSPRQILQPNVKERALILDENVAVGKYVKS